MPAGLKEDPRKSPKRCVLVLDFRYPDFISDFYPDAGDLQVFGPYMDYDIYLKKKEKKRKTWYCTISFNSAGPMTRDGPTEILVSATSQTCRDMSKFSENYWQFSAAGDEKFLYLTCDHQMTLASYKNCLDYHVLKGPHDV